MEPVCRRPILFYSTVRILLLSLPFQPLLPADIRRTLTSIPRSPASTVSSRVVSPLLSSSLRSPRFISPRPSPLFPSSRSSRDYVVVHRVSFFFDSRWTRSPTGLLPGPTVDPDAPTFPACSRVRQHACTRARARARPGFQEARRRTPTPLTIRLLHISVCVYVFARRGKGIPPISEWLRQERENDRDPSSPIE